MKHTSLLARAAAATVTLGTALAGAVVVATPAQAALVETNYGFFTFGFGTSVKSDLVGLSSGKTAFSILGCTRLAGKSEDRNVAKADVPATPPTLDLGAVSSHSETFKKSGLTGSMSTNKIAGVNIGNLGGIHLQIKGLSTSATAWADSSGKLHSAATFQVADINAQTGIKAVDDLLNKTGATASDLVKAILNGPNNQLLLPNIGVIRLGRKIERVTPTVAIANAISLRVILFGTDGKLGGNDDSRVTIGRSHARIYDNVTSSVMRGVGYAAKVGVLDGVATVGEIARQPLPCVGTNGVVKLNSTVGLNLLNLGISNVGAAEGRAYGIQNKNGSSEAWTEGKIAEISLGQGTSKLVIKGVIGHADIKMSRTGKLFKSIAGTKVASVTVGGKEQDISLGKDIVIPGLATVQFNKVDRSDPRGLSVIAVHIVLVEGAAQETGLATVDLGVARVHMNRV
jgi:hypothetical protein